MADTDKTVKEILIEHLKKFQFHGLICDEKLKLLDDDVCEEGCCLIDCLCEGCDSQICLTCKPAYAYRYDAGKYCDQCREKDNCPIPGVKSDGKTILMNDLKFVACRLDYIQLRETDFNKETSS